MTERQFSLTFHQFKHFILSRIYNVYTLIKSFSGYSIKMTSLLIDERFRRRNVLIGIFYIIDQRFHLKISENPNVKI